MLSTQFLAQDGHFLLGAVLCFMSQSLLGVYWWGVGAGFVYMIPKEVWLDPKEEGQPFFWDGAIDIGFLVWGMGASIGIISIGRIL